MRARPQTARAAAMAAAVGSLLVAVGCGAPGEGAHPGGDASGSGGSGGASPQPVDAGAGGGVGVVAAGVRWFGRVDTSTPEQPRFAWSGTGFVARFTGTALSARLDNTGGFLFKPVVDGVPMPVLMMSAGQGMYDLATALAAGVHTVELYRQTEGGQGESRLLALTVAGGALMEPPPTPARLIEVVGDSISAGYGDLGALSDGDCFPTESHWDSYEAVAARALGADLSTIAASGRGMYRNYGGDMTGTLPQLYDRALTNAAAPRWDFHIQPQAVVINLGTNDISNGKGDPGTGYRDAYRAFVETVRGRYPGAFIICTIGPMLSTAEAAVIQGHIKAVVDARAAAGDTRIALFDKILPQAPDKFACQYHPNVAENKLVGAQLAAEVRARLGW